jgi:NitT/TauT family transport system ATP-binding protein
VFLSSRIIVMAASPGRVFASMAIEEPQPRREAFRNSPRFAECCRDLSALLAQAATAIMRAPSPTNERPDGFAR